MDLNLLDVLGRDLTPEIVLASTNIVDDSEHCLKASTSPHLTEQLTGNREFLTGTLGDVMAGRVTVPNDRPLVFSLFGLGVLDLAVRTYVYDQVPSSGELRIVEHVFHELRRYGNESRARWCLSSAYAARPSLPYWAEPRPIAARPPCRTRPRARTGELIRPWPRGRALHDRVAQRYALDECPRARNGSAPVTTIFHSPTAERRPGGGHPNHRSSRSSYRPGT
jgi:hypothetical protein